MDIKALKALRNEQSLPLSDGYVKRKSRTSWVLVHIANRERSCWGNAAEILEDCQYFEATGHLRPPKGERW